MGKPPGLHHGFLRSAEEHPDRPALEVDGEVLTFVGLRDRAAALAATLCDAAPDDGTPLTAVLGSRTATAFVGTLAALLRGHGYVPLNPRYPAERTRGMLERSGSRSLIVDRPGMVVLDEVLEGVTSPLTVVVPDVGDVAELASRWPQHTVLGAWSLRPASAWLPVPTDPTSIAYLLFTSGSTGIPKGVAVPHTHAQRFVEVVTERFDFCETDRFSQMSDLTFDASIFDLFVAWGRGACVCCPSQEALIAPARFIDEAALTVWKSVPSVGVVLRRLGMLKPGRYPGLRWSIFGGEPLTTELANAWSAAAPKSAIENFYGPTEVTVACTVHRWDPERSVAEAESGIVPIGDPLPGMQAIVVDEELHEVAPGEAGELLLSGPQVTPGYVDDPERTAASFVRLPGRAGIHYRTGDRVRRPRFEGDPLRFVGRLDNQIKIHGHRIELGEVEAALREVTGLDAVIALGWPITDRGAGGITAFVAAPDLDVADLLARVARRLPEVMVPRQVRLVTDLPRNANGKFDRRALHQILEEEA